MNKHHGVSHSRKAQIYKLNSVFRHNVAISINADTDKLFCELYN